MPNGNPPTQYSAVAKTLHWVIDALIVTQFALAWSADDLPIGLHKLKLLARHFWNTDAVLMRMLPFTKPEKPT